jgi:asparagine synthase (glutamine-hydrolysing)
MCGIAGILSWSARFPVDEALLTRACGGIAHRGPDGRGIHIQDIGEARVGLAHSRLAILDPDPRANQPFFDAHGRAIVFNGEIYNFRELRRELSRARPSHAWRTEGDTEVLLLAYDVWGRECLQRLNGILAFGIWEPATRSLFLARDRMGQKPLYYVHDPAGYFAFASEIGPLRELPWMRGDVDGQSLIDYLAWGYQPRGTTIYREVRKAAPATWISVSPGHFDSHVYFRPNEPPPLEKPIGPRAAVRRTRELLREAVRKQLVSDVPVGCFLSGGVDSSVVTAAMCDAVPDGQRVLTFSIGFDDRRYDETRYAAIVAKHLGTEHRRFVVKPNAAEDLPMLAAHIGEPFGDSSALPTHYLARETRPFVKVALSGDGGDELFGGYDRYRAMRLGRRLSNWAGWLRTLAWLPGSDPRTPQARLKRLIRTLHLPPGERYASYVRLFDPVMMLRLVKDKAGMLAAMEASAQRLVAERFEEFHGPPLRGTTSWRRDEVQAAMAVDRETYLPEDLLMKIDRCAMRHALEVRSPFMDHDLVHFAAGLPSSLLRRKQLLRDAFAADLPAIVFGRRKMGFAVPIGQWFRRGLRGMLRETLLAGDSFGADHFDMPYVKQLIDEHETGEADHAQRLYALLMLELWWRSSRRL